MNPPSGWPEKVPTSEPYTNDELDRMITDGFAPCCADDLAPRLFATIRRLLVPSSRPRPKVVPGSSRTTSVPR